MIRSLRTGITGLRGHQTRMDVIGNNIANVNTISFKRSRAAFKEILGQRLLGSASGTAVNNSFIGFGITVGSITQNWGQGSFEQTNIATDMALNGDGFFVARGTQGQNLLTRDGTFVLDQGGQLVTANGLPVLGYPLDADGNADTTQIGPVVVDFASRTPPQTTNNVTIDGNISADTEVGESFEMSRVIYDEQGTAHTMVFTATKTATDNEWDYELSYAGDETPPPFDASTTGTLTFDTDGALVSPTTLSINWDAGVVGGGATFDVDLSNITQYSGSSTASISDQDGFTFGRLQGYGFDPDGTLILNFTNGESLSTHQLAVANIDNPNGLNNVGENYYSATANSGELQFGRSGIETETTIVAGALEMSNVDLAQEFTDMIVAQRGYQASARVITTSDEILQETVALKR